MNRKLSCIVSATSNTKINTLNELGQYVAKEKIFIQEYEGRVFLFVDLTREDYNALKQSGMEIAIDSMSVEIQ